MKIMLSSNIPHKAAAPTFSHGELTDEELTDLLTSLERHGFANCDTPPRPIYDKNTDEVSALPCAFIHGNKVSAAVSQSAHQCAVNLSPIERYNHYLKQQAEEAFLNAMTEVERRKRVEAEEIAEEMRAWKEEQDRKRQLAENSAADDVGSAVKPSSSSTRQPRKQDASVHAFKHKRWRDLTSAQKLSVAVQDAFNRGGSAFSLNISSAREASLCASRDLRKDLRDIVSSALRKFGQAQTPIALTLETNDAGRLHLHGVIGSHFSEVELKALRKAMREAFGCDVGMKKVRQMNTKPLTDAAGWSDYLLKDQVKTSRLLGISASGQVFLNQPMVRSAEKTFEEWRKSRPRSGPRRSITASFAHDFKSTLRFGYNALSGRLPGRSVASA